MRLRTQILAVITLPIVLPLVFIMILGPRYGSERRVWEQVEADAQAYRKGAPTGAGISAFPDGTADEPILGVVVEKQGSRTLVFRPAPKREEENWFRSPITFPLVLYFTIVAFVFVFFARFDRAIAGLARATQRIAQGDLETATAISGNREVSILGQAMESMRIKLKDARDRKSFLLMGLSHDFRTPITAIRGYVEAMQDGMAGSKDEQGSFLRIMHQKTLQLESMISRWLDLVRLETGERYLVFSETPVARYFEELAQQLSMDARVANRRFETDIAITQNVVCPMDIELLNRSFENLFSNAVRATGPGGRIGLRAGAEQQGLFIDFWDDGNGVPDDERLLIWEPFFRGKGVESQGSGLGLAVVKSILASHKWDIELVASPNGALFRITIPKANLMGAASSFP